MGTIIGKNLPTGKDKEVVKEEEKETLKEDEDEIAPAQKKKK